MAVMFLHREPLLQRSDYGPGWFRICPGFFLGSVRLFTRRHLMMAIGFMGAMLLLAFVATFNTRSMVDRASYLRACGSIDWAHRSGDCR